MPVLVSPIRRRQGIGAEVPLLEDAGLKWGWLVSRRLDFIEGQAFCLPALDVHERIDVCVGESQLRANTSRSGEKAFVEVVVHRPGGHFGFRSRVGRANLLSTQAAVDLIDEIGDLQALRQLTLLDEPL